jgi:hypothetical protein
VKGNRSGELEFKIAGGELGFGFCVGEEGAIGLAISGSTTWVGPNVDNKAGNGKNHGPVLCKSTVAMFDMVLNGNDNSSITT